MNIKYALRRSNRKTIGITIKNGELFVSAPMRVSVAEIEKFILKKRDWIERNLKKDKFLYEVIAGRTILVKGKELPLRKGELGGIDECCVCIKSFGELKKLYVDAFGDEFLKAVDRICNVSGLKYNTVSFKDYKSRWGCCDRQSNIIFNYKLMMLPQDLWCGVIVHELCHTVYMDHSPKFHALCKKILPSYSAVHRQINLYSCICSLYS